MHQEDTLTTTADQLVTQAASDYTDAKNLANTALNKAESALLRANNAVAGIGWQTVNAAANPIDITAVAQVKPNAATDFSTDVQTAYNNSLATLHATIQPQIQNFLATFFPDISTTLKTGSDAALIDIIINGRGVPIAVENALYNRAKDREVQEALRAEQEVINASAARGFSIPTGVVNHTIATIQQDSQLKLSGINREIAFKAFDTLNENHKFAITQAVSLRAQFVGALGTFIRTAMVQSDAADYAKTIGNAKEAFYRQAVAVYSAEVDEEKFRINTLLENRSQDLRMEEINMGGATSVISSRVDAADVQARTAIASAAHNAAIAAAAMATRNSTISVGANI